MEKKKIVSKLNKINKRIFDNMKTLVTSSNSFKEAHQAYLDGVNNGETGSWQRRTSERRQEMSWESLAWRKGSEMRGKDMKEETWTTLRSWLPSSSKGSKQMENLGQTKRGNKT